jgi:hypothetical protein
MKLEMSQLNDYECFINSGIYNHDPIPDHFKKIYVHLKYDIKHDGHHKACFIGNGQLTETPVKSIYSGVAPLHSL